jgi:hypothetical protein
MAESQPPQRKERVRATALSSVLALVCLLVAAPGSADLRRPQRPPRTPPMRFVHVTSADPACAPTCPEWLSAEGQIEAGSAAQFAEALKRLNGRRLPILIHSPGGSVPDAGAMGELIRARGLAVAVARTLIANCSETALKCPDSLGKAISSGASCASACVLVLAGGIERFVGPVPLVGVHQITTTVKSVEGVAHLTSTRKLYEQPGIDTAVETYLAAMGIGDPVMTLMRKTPAASIRWLSLTDLKASHLGTLALDPADPILSSGLNGLNGRAFDGKPPPADLLHSNITVSAAGRGPALEIAFRSRRGGGTVEVEAAESATAGTIDAPSPHWLVTFRAAGVEPLQLKTAGATPVRVFVPRDRFCALLRGGSVVAKSDGLQDASPSIERSTLDSGNMFLAQACP